MAILRCSDDDKDVMPFLKVTVVSKPNEDYVGFDFVFRRKKDMAQEFVSRECISELNFGWMMDIACAVQQSNALGEIQEFSKNELGLHWSPTLWERSNELIVIVMPRRKFRGSYRVHVFLKTSASSDDFCLIVITTTLEGLRSFGIDLLDELVNVQGIDPAFIESQRKWWSDSGLDR